MTPNHTASGHSFLGVFGSGAWGMALALAFHHAGHNVTVYGRNKDFIAEVRKTGKHPKLPDSVTVPESLNLTDDLDVLLQADALISGVPAQSFRSAFSPFGGFLKAGLPVIQTAKGIECETGLLLPTVLKEIAPQVKGFMLSGPSFADDVARGLPTAITLASDGDLEDCTPLLKWFEGSILRPYTNNDIKGTALAGAFKNVVAIACGITIGAGLGESARASVAARGFSEMRRLNHVMGGKDETLMGLCGIGDLMLTASSPLSRNYRFGLKIGSDEYTPQAGETIEGIATIEALENWAKIHNTELPLTHTVSLILKGHLNLTTAIDVLLSRPFKTDSFF